MKRYLRIYWVLFKLNFAKMLAYRADFYNSLIANGGWSIFIIISFLLITSRTSSVYGWSREELLLLASLYNVFVSIFYIFFSRNFNTMAETINYGKLDAFLMKPIDAQFLTTCLNIGFGSTIRMVVGLITVGYLLFIMGVAVTPLTILTFIIMDFVSIVILYSFWFIVMTLTIWFTNLENLSNLLYDTNHTTRFPPEMYRGASIVLFVLLFPLTFILVTPAKVLLQKATPYDLILPIILATAMFSLSRKFWRFALRSYTSASG